VKREYSHAERYRSSDKVTKGKVGGRDLGLYVAARRGDGMASWSWIGIPAGSP